jgi:predicted ATPase
MLTRLKVSGFKNLIDVDIPLGPFTCVAGANGTGKSNLFDAIQLLSALASHTLIDAARSVRSEEGRISDVRDLFHRIGNTDTTTEMSFEADMIIPQEGLDDLGQQAKATTTFLRYRVVLAYREDDSLPSSGTLELIEEKLERLKLGDWKEHLKFANKRKEWRDSVLIGRRAAPFISTRTQEENRVIRLHQDGGSSGRPQTILAKNLPRTVLSTVNAAESPTVLLARREMQSWRLLQLEASSLREPDEFTTPPGLGSDGSHLPATLYQLARSQKSTPLTHKEEQETWIYDRVAARLSELIDDVSAVSIDRDERRELLTLTVKDHRGTVHPARSLSAGTLRFLALSVLELDPKATGLICMEEPENGIHPARIPSILRLLQDIATDVDYPVGSDNPLCQVIVNTHSPSIVQQVPDETLLVAELREIVQDDQRFNGIRLSWLSDTWRTDALPDVHPVSKGQLLAYLKPTIPRTPLPKLEPKKPPRVIERSDIQPLLFDFSEIE